MYLRLNYLRIIPGGMKDSFLIGLLQNIAILLSFSMLYESVWLKKWTNNSLLAKCITGTIIGTIGIILMFTPWILMPGISFDTRSIMLSISGLFFGTIPTLIAMVMTLVLRIFIGGDGMWMGIAVIISSGFIGLIWRYLRPDWKQKNYIVELLGLGFIVHLFMLICIVFLPSQTFMHVLKTIALPLLLIYTPTTLLLGLIMLRQDNNWQNKLAKERLKRVEIQFQSVMQSTNIASLILDKNFNISFCNNFLADKFRCIANKIIGKNWFQMFFDADTQRSFNQLLTESINNHQLELQFNQERLLSDGTKLFFAWHIALIYNDIDELDLIACIGVDLTERAEYERELKLKNNEIEKKNAIYKQLNDDLQFAKEKAEESDRLKSSFLANLSHEIRTPMNAILGFTDLLRSEDLSLEKRGVFIDIIHNRGQHLLTIINDIVEMSKIDTGQVVPNYSYINVNQFLKSIYESIKISNQLNENIDFLIQLPDLASSPLLYTDETKLNQILSNLLVNAFKFTNKGFVKIGYNVHSINQIAFFVEDTGIGIDSKYHSIIFDRFRQIDESSSVLNNGSGLGLAISKAYIELLNGSITIKSEQGIGSLFTVCLPLNNNEIAVFSNDAITDQDNLQSDDLLLIAEDDDLNYLYYSELFADTNYKIIRACNGEEAVAICQNNMDVHLVLMDIKMPKMNGIDAIKIIKQRRPNLPIIAQTAYKLTDLDETAYNAGFDAYLSKPINSAKLLKTISALLAKRISE